MELLPTKATFAPGEPVEVEVRGADGDVTVSLWRLDEQIDEAEARDCVARFRAQPVGGYGVEASAATSALDVLVDPLSRPRYGFVSHYEADRETAGVAENIRRLHLNAVQFYDWMYRHADLMPPQDEFEDALGRPISLDTVRRLAAAVREAGSLPLAYAAVYAAGREEWPRWVDDGLYRADGSPWTLGEDFLWNVDPTSERWLDHFAADLERALALGYAGFHLDQYGAPKKALRRDGTEVDLAEAFPALIDALAGRLPNARLIFNNVNDFPVWSTAPAKQNAVYIEVWPPHDRLGHLAELVAKARLLAPEKAVILAAYLSCYAGDELAASAAERLQLATVFSHGGTTLLHGEERGALTEAYYVRHKELGPESSESARGYYDFAVRYGDLLFDREAVDVTRMSVAGVNREVTIEASVAVVTDCVPGALWTRVVRTSQGLLVSLIDLSTQVDDLWDAPKRAPVRLGGVRVGVERARRSAPRFLTADPEDSPSLQRLESTEVGRYDVVELPAFCNWCLLWIREAS
jgi:dextranase